MNVNDTTLSASEAVGQRWAQALYRRYAEVGAAKRVARAFGIEVRTAQAWMAGQAPFARELVKAAQLFGPAILFEVLAPQLVPPSEVEMQRALADVKAEVERLGDRLARLVIEGGG